MLHARRFTQCFARNAQGHQATHLTAGNHIDIWYDFISLFLFDMKNMIEAQSKRFAEELIAQERQTLGAWRLSPTMIFSILNWYH